MARTVPEGFFPMMPAGLAAMIKASQLRLSYWNRVSRNPCEYPENSEPLAASIVVALARDPQKVRVCEGASSWWGLHR